MVFFIAHDATLCRLIDTIAERHPQLSTEALLPFIEATLHNTVEAVPPSQLKDALWLYLHLKREHHRLAQALGTASCTDGRTEAGEHSQMKVTLACSTLVVATLSPQPLGKASATANPSTGTSLGEGRAHQSNSSGSRSSFLPVDLARRRLDSLLRKMQDAINDGGVATGTTTQTPAAPSSFISAALESETCSQLPAVELALAVFASPRKVAALLTPATLSLLIRDLESLWCFLYLCKCVKLRLLRQSRMLVGGSATGHRRVNPRDKQATVQRKEESEKGTNASGDDEEEGQLPRDEFFHDYELLLPADILEAAAGAHHSSTDDGIDDLSADACSLVTVRSLLKQCTPEVVKLRWQEQSSALRQARKALHQQQQQQRSGKGELSENAAEPSAATPQGIQAQPPRVPVLVPRPVHHDPSTSDDLAFCDATEFSLMHPTPSVGVVIVPTISSSVANPSRMAKNHRVDVIEQAAMRYYYDQLTTLHGSASASTSGGGGGNGSRSGGMNMPRHLHARLSGKEMTVIDPAQMARHSLDGSRIGSDSIGGGEAAHLSNAAAAALGGNGIVPAHRRMKSLQQMASEKASFAQFMRESFIGLDIQIMALSGAAIGYYMGVLRGASKETCWTYAVFGLVVMMLVDAGLLLIRLGREDGATRRERKRIAKQRAKLFSAGKEAVELRSTLTEQLKRELHGQVACRSVAATTGTSGGSGIHTEAGKKSQ